MRVRLDENLSYRVANAIKAVMANRSGLIVDWVRDDNPPATLDPTWITKFSDDGGNVIVSGDYNILNHWPDLVAYMESGLVSFFPPAGFGKLKGFGQAALIVRWWPVIIEKAKISARGDCWRMPMTWTPDIDGFKRLEDPRYSSNEKREGSGIIPLPVRKQFRPD